MTLIRPFSVMLTSVALAAALTAQSSTQQAQQQYQHALNAINAADWARAEAEMAAAEKQLAKLDSKNASGALYWQAYAASKLGQRDKALKSVDKLLREYQNSDWQQDAAALKLQLDMQRVPDAPALAPVQPLPPFPPEGALAPLPPGWPPGAHVVSDADELKLLALNGLMNTEPAKAMPLLEKVIAGNSDATVKDRALFVLAQSSSPEAISALTRIAQTNPDTNVREHAVRYLGMEGGQQGAAALAQIYAASSSVALKRNILRSYMIGGDTTQLIAAAQSEKNQQLRSEAIRELGLGGSRQALTALTGLYQGARDRAGSEAVIQALFLHGSAGALVGLARKETDPQLKEDIVQKLSLMHDPAATAYLEEILKQ